MDLWPFIKTLSKRWWALLSCSVFTGIGVYAAISGKGNYWVVAASGVAAMCLFVVAAYRAWRDEHHQRKQSERAFDWLEIGKRFKELDGVGVVSAHWNQESKTKESKWEIKSNSEAYTHSRIEMCRQAGRRFLDSKALCSKLPEMAEIVDDGDRWLVLIRENLNVGKARGTLSSIHLTNRSESEFGDIPNLTGASQALCLRLSNDERSSADCEEKAVTIAAGFVCAEGLVLLPDTEEQWGYTKTNAEKIQKYSF
jgi:hypothetical protein